MPEQKDRKDLVGDFACPSKKIVNLQKRRQAKFSKRENPKVD
jgi:hypothetical protein